ncbi:MAG: CRISPR-associated endonuclease Cas2, partial [Smithella sp.]
MSNWLLIYDICDANRLRKVAGIANAFGCRVQRSVFELSCSRETMENIRKRIGLLMEDPDSVAYITLCQRDYAGLMRLG